MNDAPLPRTDGDEIALAPDAGDRRGLPLWLTIVVLLVAAGAVVGATASVVRLTADEEPVPAVYATASTDRIGGRLATPAPAARGTTSYEGYGVWVDAFDFSPPYAGPDPPVRPADVREMASVGARTVFLQAARLDDRSPGGLEDPWLLAEMLLTAHAAGLDVVGWYLPKWTEDAADLERLRAIESFEVLGHRFDGVAVDIEWTGEIDPAVRSERLVELTARYREEHPGDPLGAIVLPPVLIEVVNDEFWPDFPWRDLAPLYDVWLPMSYWSGRSDASGYGDGYTYNEESVRRLRANLADPVALVHAIGGIGGTDGVDDPLDPPEPLATIDEIEAFTRSLTDSGAVGASIYDWDTLEPTIREPVAALVTAAVDAGGG